MFWLFVITLCPILCEAEIKINITVASNKDDAILKYAGQDNKLVTEHEVKIFNISMANLNRGFRKELGKIPDGILLKDPTTYGNLFHKYKWPEVNRHMKVEKIEVIEVINRATVLKSTEVTNNSTDNVETERSLFENVENNVFSSWPNNGMPDEDIAYNVTINFEGSNFKYENNWKDGSLKSKTVRFGKSLNGNLTIKPGQSCVKKLSATKTIFVLKINYIAKLTGNVIGDYENLYGKYHFWAPTIDNIMKAAGVPNEIRASERVEIRCYTDPKLEIIIYDNETGLPVQLRTKRRLLWKLKPKKLWFLGEASTTVKTKIGKNNKDTGKLSR